MNNKNKNTLLISIGIVLVGCFIFMLVYDINLVSIANDSGFDTSYDSGGGSGGDGDSILWLIYLAINYPIPTAIVVIVFIVMHIIEKNKKRNFDNNYNYSFIDSKYPMEERRNLIKQMYQIFYDVQMAWMNFDYNRLRELVSDELYNMYFNELEMLKLKGHKNIMEGFKILSITFIDQREENGVIEYCINLKIAMFDYIVDSNGKVVRGSKSTYHKMYYMLTFASSAKKLDNCPNCSAPLPENSICEYCHSHVQGLRQMRLVKKVNIKQERM